MGTTMKPVHIDKNGIVSDDTPEGIDAWLKTYDDMKASGATEEEAKKAADHVKTNMDKICRNGYEIIEEEE